MAAPLGRLDYLLPDAAAGPTGDDQATAAWPRSWATAGGAAAMATVFVCDVLALCDRLPGVTAPDGRPLPSMPRSQVRERLGNLRDGHARLDVLFGGACLQGAEAHRLRNALHDPARPGCLRTEPLADLRLAAHPGTLMVKRALVDLHNSLCDEADVSDPRALTTALWHACIRRDVLPALCGDKLTDGARTRAFVAAHPDGGRQALPLEVVLGPFSLLVPMLLAPTDAPAAQAALERQIRRTVRYDIPGPAALLKMFGLPADGISAHQTLPAYLVDESRAATYPFGPLGARLFSDTVEALLQAERPAAKQCPNANSTRAFKALRNIAQQSLCPSGK